MTPQYTRNHGESPRTFALRFMRKSLADGTWAYGERLPTELSLSEVLGLSRKTIRAAYAQIENDGSIVCKETSGRFRMSESATAAKSSCTQTICIVSPGDIYAGIPNAWTEVINGVLAATHRADHTMAVMKHDFMTSGAPRGLGELHPMGLILPTLDNLTTSEILPVLHRLRKADISVVIGVDEPELADFDRIIPDHKNAMLEAVNKLVEMGRRRILRVWLSPRHSWIKARDDGYEEGVKTNGIRSLPPVLLPELHKRSQIPEQRNFHIRARQYLGFLYDTLKSRERPDAIVVSSDCDIFAVAAACRLFGINPEKDIAIVGFDNYWQTCWERLLEDTVPAFTVDKQNNLWGEAFVQMLIDRAANRLPQNGKLRLIPSRLAFPEKN